MAAFRALKPKFKECYEGWLKTTGGKNNIEGKLTLKMVIKAVADEDYAGMGDVQVLRDDLEHRFLTGCLVNSTESLRFEIPDKPITVRYPFIFASSSDASKRP